MRAGASDLSLLRLTPRPPPRHNSQRISKNSHHPLLRPDGAIFPRRHPGAPGQPDAVRLQMSAPVSGSQVQPLLRETEPEPIRLGVDRTHILARACVCPGFVRVRLAAVTNKATPILNRFVGDIRGRRAPSSPQPNSAPSDRAPSARRQLAPPALRRRAVCREALQLLPLSTELRAAEHLTADADKAAFQMRRSLRGEARLPEMHLRAL